MGLHRFGHSWSDLACRHLFELKGFPGGSVVKNLPANEEDIEDVGSIPGSGRAPVEGKGNPLQYFCLENAMDKGAWQATVHRIANSQKGLSEWARIIALLVAQLCPTLCDPMDCSPSRLFCSWNSPGKNIGLGCHALLQGIFLIQGIEPAFPVTSALPMASLSTELSWKANILVMLG